MMNLLHEEEIDTINDFHDAALAKDSEKIDELFAVAECDVEDDFKHWIVLHIARWDSETAMHLSDSN